MDRKFLYGAAYGLLLALLAAGLLGVAARRPSGNPITLLPQPTAYPVRVYVLGAVGTPGVYPLTRGSIVQDALEAAGGTTGRADLSGLNLAQLLQDGDRVHIPELPPTPTVTPPPKPTITVGPGTPTPTPLPTATPAPTNPKVLAPAVGAKININTATLAELDTLPRIGPAIAQRIIDYRTQNGPFRTIENIMNVRGIGPATFEQLKELITVGP